MSDKYNITDAELEIMNILWDKKKATISEIIDELDKKEKRNKSTVKTLLYTLVDKNAVKSEKDGKMPFCFSPNLEKKEFLKKENKNFISKLYNGSINKLLLNFVQEKEISKDELKELMDLLEEDNK